jgi:hypothetical protein
MIKQPSPTILGVNLFIKKKKYMQRARVPRTDRDAM